MKQRCALLLATLSLVVPGFAQTRRGYVAAYGEASVSVRPDQARVNLGVITTAQSATDAAARNADLAAAVIAAIRTVLGNNADIRTVTYNVGPTYQYPPGGGQPTLTGFQVTNVVQAVVNDTNLIGRVIDAAIGAGANRIDGIAFSLRDDESVRNQALRAAALRARQKAEAIAAGLGVRTGAVLAVDEGIQQNRVAVPVDRAATAATTPVEVGTLEIRATVTLQLEVLPQ